jgi:acetyl-CoA carboxylase alpha subunit
MAGLRVPTISVVTGEGASGGALGIGVTDRILILENAFYSVISPEGCAAILWKDGERTPEAAEALKLTSKDLLELGVIDGVIREPPGGAHRDPAVAMEEVKRSIQRELDAFSGWDPSELVRQRRRKFRRLAVEPGRFPDLGAPRPG